jgi:hypothetical protein
MRKILVVFITALIVGSTATSAQKMTLTDKVKLIDADENYQKEYWDAAYGLYKELHVKYPEDSKISYKAGKVSLILKKYDEALTFLTKAAEKKPKGVKDLEFWLGQAQHKEGLLDQALANYEAYRKTLRGKAQTTDIVNDYIHQVSLAKQYMSIPVNVKIINMGEAINSEYIESNPSVTADGKVLIFSTCRPENTGGLKDPTVGIYFQDIWMSERDSVSGKWMDAEIIRGALNSKEHDASPSISADGNVIIIYKSVNGGDLYYSKKRRNGEWREPEQVKGKVNSTYFETSGCITADKKKIYFVSERVGGTKEAKAQGNGDIWVATKTGSYEYAEPVNLGSTVNSIDDEVSVFVHPDGTTIFFASNGKNSIGGYDIFKSEWKDGKWTTPINLGYPINTLGDEKQFSLTADGKTAYITSHREDTKGEFDIYEIDMSNYVLPDPEGKNQGSKGITSGSISILKGKVLNGKEGTPVETVVKISDEKGQLIDELETSESGDFLIVLEGDKTYTLNVKAEGFNAYEEKISLKKTPGKTETVVKAIFLEDAD